MPGHYGAAGEPKALRRHRHQRSVRHEEALGQHGDLHRVVHGVATPVHVGATKPSPAFALFLADQTGADAQQIVSREWLIAALIAAACPLASSCARGAAHLARRGAGRGHIDRGVTVPTKPWVTFHQPDPDREYLVLLSELPLKRFRDLGMFLLYSWRIQRQLRHTSGLVGYSLLARIRKRQFWTLSVWEGEATLRQFVIENPHGQVMRALQGKMDQTRFLRWSMRASEFPPRWQEALTRRGTAEGSGCASQLRGTRLTRRDRTHVFRQTLGRLGRRTPRLIPPPGSPGSSVDRGRTSMCHSTAAASPWLLSMAHHRIVDQHAWGRALQ
jgi:hypothetical protein